MREAANWNQNICSETQLSCERGNVTRPGLDDYSLAHYLEFQICKNYQIRTLQTMTYYNDDNAPQLSKTNILISGIGIGIIFPPAQFTTRIQSIHEFVKTLTSFNLKILSWCVFWMDVLDT